MADLSAIQAEVETRAVVVPGDRPPSPYDTLNSDHIVRTAQRLERRITERFPDAGLASVAAHLADLAEDANQTARWISRPIVSLRVATWVLVGLIVAGAVASLLALEHKAGVNFIEFVGAVEAGINDIVLIGAAIFFLVTLETRIKRDRALKALHRLRSLAHIVDMHQLTKSPEGIYDTSEVTASSPKRTLSAFELSRYLDYCTELFSLCGKIAAIYVQEFDDSVALGAVNEIEELTTGLSRKVWQKLIIIRAAEEH